MKQETTRTTVFKEDGVEVILEVRKEIATPIMDELHKRVGEQHWKDRLSEELEWILNG